MNTKKKLHSSIDLRKSLTLTNSCNSSEIFIKEEFKILNLIIQSKEKLVNGETFTMSQSKETTNISIMLSSDFNSVKILNYKVFSIRIRFYYFEIFVMLMKFVMGYILPAIQIKLMKAFMVLSI